MLKIRHCEEYLVEPIVKGEVKCPCHLCSGQEAVAAGVCAALDKEDYIFGTHRSHGHFIAKGGGVCPACRNLWKRDGVFTRQRRVYASY